MSEVTDGAHPGLGDTEGLLSSSAQWCLLPGVMGWGRALWTWVFLWCPGVADDVQGNSGASCRDLFSLYTRPLRVWLKIQLLKGDPSLRTESTNWRTDRDKSQEVPAWAVCVFAEKGRIWGHTGTVREGTEASRCPPGACGPSLLSG